MCDPLFSDLVRSLLVFGKMIKSVWIGHFYICLRMLDLLLLNLPANIKDVLDFLVWNYKTFKSFEVYFQPGGEVSLFKP